MKKTIKFSFVLMVCLMVVAMTCASAFAGKKVRVATVALPETNIHQGLVKWKEILKEKSGGKLEVDILGRAVMGGTGK